MKHRSRSPRPSLKTLWLAPIGLLLVSTLTGCMATAMDEEEAAHDIETREQELRVSDEIPNPNGEGDCKGSTNPDGCVDCWAQRDDNCIECGGAEMYCCRHPDKCDVLNEPTNSVPTGGTLSHGFGTTVQTTTRTSR